MRPRNTNEFGGVAAFSLLYVASNRTLFLARPSPTVAVHGLPAMIVAYLIGAVLIAALDYATLIPFWRLGRSVYDDKAQHRSAIELAAIAMLLVEQALILLVQASVYVQALKAFSFFRSPRWALGGMLAALVWPGCRLSNRSVIRCAQTWMFFQLIILPFLIMPLRNWSTASFHGLMKMPALSGVATLMPVATVLYAAGGVILLVTRVEDARTLSRAIPWVVSFKFLTFVFGGVVVAATLTPSLLRLTPFPVMMYLQSTRTPGLERYDLLLLFLFANVTVGTLVLVGRAAALGLRAFGVGPILAPTIVTLIVVASSMRVVIPTGVQPIAAAIVAVSTLARLLFLALPRKQGGSK